MLPCVEIVFVRRKTLGVNLNEKQTKNKSIFGCFALGDLCPEPDIIAAGVTESRKPPGPVHNRGPNQTLQLWGSQFHHLQSWHITGLSSESHNLCYLSTNNTLLNTCNIFPYQHLVYLTDMAIILAFFTVQVKVQKSLFFNHYEMNGIFYSLSKVPNFNNVTLRPSEQVTAQEIDAYFRQELIYKRNERMGKRVKALLEEHPEKSFFFAFGAGWSLIIIKPNMDSKCDHTSEWTAVIPDLQRLLLRHCSI